MKRKLHALIVGTSALVVLAACTTGGSESSLKPNSDGVVKVSVGVLPIVSNAPMQLGIDKGIFKKHGFDVTLETGQGGAALLPAVLNGEMQFTLSNPLSLMIAREQGLEIDVVSGWSNDLGEGDGASSLWARADSGINDVADIAGKRVAVNALRTQGEVSVKELVDRAGGDPSTIEFVEMAVQDAPAALAAGDIDVAWAPEPFQTILRDSGATFLAWNVTETTPGISSLMVVTSPDFAQGSPELVERFADAIDEVAAYANGHHDEINQTLTTFLGIDSSLADRLKERQRYGNPVDRDALQLLADQALRWGVLKEPANVDELIP
jgi:NitT/TauT family transport system substrate-binding protein